MAATLTAVKALLHASFEGDLAKIVARVEVLGCIYAALSSLHAASIDPLIASRTFERNYKSIDLSSTTASMSFSQIYLCRKIGCSKVGYAPNWGCIGRGT